MLCYNRIGISYGGSMTRLIEQFAKFGIVGVICTIIDYGIMVFLVEVLSIPYLYSCAISFSVSVIVNYLLSMKYVFSSREDLSKEKEFVIFVALSIAGLLLTELFMWMMVDKLSIHYMFSKIVVTGIVMVFNFVTRKAFLEQH